MRPRLGRPRYRLSKDHDVQSGGEVGPLTNQLHFTTITSDFVEILHHLFPTRSEVQNSFNPLPTGKDFERAACPTGPAIRLIRRQGHRRARFSVAKMEEIVNRGLDEPEHPGSSLMIRVCGLEPTAARWLDEDEVWELMRRNELAAPRGRMEDRVGSPVLSAPLVALTIVMRINLVQEAASIPWPDHAWLSNHRRAAKDFD